MSGRALRRLPVLALARYIGIGSLSLPPSGVSTPSTLEERCRSNTPTLNRVNGSAALQQPTNHVDGEAKRSVGADVEVWLEGMEKVVREQAAELERLI
jgi:hypothetical protein